MKKKIPINYIEEEINGNPKYSEESIINMNKLLKKPDYLLFIKIWAWILILVILFCSWYFLGRTELDILVDEMSEINSNIENRDKFIIKLVDDNKKDRIKFDLVQKDFIQKTNAKILSNWTIKTYTWSIK